MTGCFVNDRQQEAIRHVYRLPKHDPLQILDLAVSLADRACEHVYRDELRHQFWRLYSRRYLRCSGGDALRRRVQYGGREYFQSLKQGRILPALLFNAVPVNLP